MNFSTIRTLATSAALAAMLATPLAWATTAPTQDSVVATSALTKDGQDITKPEAPVALDRSKVPQVLNMVLPPADKVYAKFDAGHGMTGWIIVQGGRQSQTLVAYTFENDSRMIFGNMLSIGTDGQIVVDNDDFIAKFAPSSLEKDLSALWGQAAESSWFAQGAPDNRAKTIVYAFVDANCIYCHLAYKALEPYLDAENTTLQVRWIPVAVLGPASIGKAAALLGPKDPVSVLRNGHDSWAEKNSDGFVSVEPTADQRTIIEQNNAFMMSTGASGTPAFIHKDENGKVKVTNGMQLLSTFAKMAQMPAIANMNPILKEYEN